MFIIITATFFLMNTLPGDPVQTATKVLPKDVAAALHEKWGFDKPVLERYGIYLQNLIRGDLGESMKTPGVTAASIIGEKFPVSARLGLQALIFGVAVGLLLGVMAALRRNSIVDYIVIFLAIVFVSVPSFVLAACLQKLLGGTILPIIGWPTSNNLFDGFEYTILPTLAVAFGSIATYARYMRTSVLDVLGCDYILTAKSKGLSQTQVISRHVLRNSMTPIITLLGPQVAGIVSGSFVIERIFCIPGLGKYYVDSVNNRDFSMIMATTIFFSLLFLISVLITDVIYGIVDPRILIDGKKK